MREGLLSSKSFKWAGSSQSIKTKTVCKGKMSTEGPPPRRTRLVTLWITLRAFKIISSTICEWATSKCPQMNRLRQSTPTEVQLQWIVKKTLRRLRSSKNLVARYHTRAVRTCLHTSTRMEPSTTMTRNSSTGACSRVRNKTDKQTNWPRIQCSWTTTSTGRWKSFTMKTRRVRRLANRFKTSQPWLSDKRLIWSATRTQTLTATCCLRWKITRTRAMVPHQACCPHCPKPEITFTTLGRFGITPAKHTSNSENTATGKRSWRNRTLTILTPHAT